MAFINGNRTANETHKIERYKNVIIDVRHTFMKQFSNRLTFHEDAVIKKNFNIIMAMRINVQYIRK